MMMTLGNILTTLVVWSSTFVLGDYIARVPVYLDGTSNPRQLVRYKQLPYKDVFKPPCIYPGALIEDENNDDSWMCSLRCECVENGNIWCFKKCDHTQAELHDGKKCLVSTNVTRGACCPKIQCDDNLKRKKLVNIKLQGTPPGVELFCERGAPMPLSFCSTFSMAGERYDWGRIPSMARCGPGPMQCLEYYRDYAIDPSVNESVRYYLYTSSVNSTTEVQREELRADADAPHAIVYNSGFDSRERVVKNISTVAVANATAAELPILVVMTDALVVNTANSSNSGVGNEVATGSSSNSSTTVRFRET